MKTLQSLMSGLKLFYLTCLLIVTSLAMASGAMAGQPLVSAQWLHQNLDNPDIRLIDLQPPQGFQKVHMVGAVNSQYGQWRHKKPLKGKSLPDVAYLEGLLGSMGISEKDHVILTPIGINAGEIAVATRIYWTLKVLGHENVSILDGGLIAYSKMPNPRFTRSYTPPKPETYKASPDFALAPQAPDIYKAWEKGIRFVDYRSPQEFLGKDRSPRPGTIPGSVNLPYDLFVNKGNGGTFKSVDDIKTLYDNANIKQEGPEIAFCNSGHRASLAWFVASELLGNKEARLYDGSMNEWSQHPEYPVEIPNK